MLEWTEKRGRRGRGRYLIISLLHLDIGLIRSLRLILLVREKVVIIAPPKSVSILENGCELRAYISKVSPLIVELWFARTHPPRSSLCLYVALRAAMRQGPKLMCIWLMKALMDASQVEKL